MSARQSNKLQLKDMTLTDIEASIDMFFSTKSNPVVHIDADLELPFTEDLDNQERAALEKWRNK